MPKLLRSLPGVEIETIGFDEDHLHMMMTSRLWGLPFHGCRFRSVEADEQQVQAGGEQEAEQEWEEE